MFARLELDVLSAKPDWVVLSCGINDVWHGWRGVRLSAFKKYLTRITERIESEGISIMVLTTTVIGEEPANHLNRKLTAYNEVQRLLARSRGYLLADVNAELHSTIKALAAANDPRQIVTRDGVHLNALGNQILARVILRSFGFDASSMENAEKQWASGGVAAPKD